MAMRLPQTSSDDPRKLRELFHRTRELAGSHDVASVVVGLAGGDGDLLFPEFVTFLESALRVEDSIFRMTRDRAVAFLADVSGEGAAEIVGRLREDFAERFPATEALQLRVGFFEVPAGAHNVTAKEILPAVFP